MCTLVSFLPQAIKLIKTKESDDKHIILGVMGNFIFIICVICVSLHK